MNPANIRQLQQSLGVPATGIFDSATTTAMNGAVAKSLSKNKDVVQYAGNNSADSILNAYMTGDWSGVVSLSGKPFTDEQQKAAVAEAGKTLAPAYKAQEAYDTATTEDALRAEQENLAASSAADAKQFGKDKNALDQNAADSGVLFSGSRTQKLNDLRTTYQERDAAARRQATERLGSAARGFQYDYGNHAISGLSDLYKLPGTTTYNPNAVNRNVTPSTSLSAAYDPTQFNFQGTKPVAQNAQVQTRAATLLANRANKLSLSGTKLQY